MKHTSFCLPLLCLALACSEGSVAGNGPAPQVPAFGAGDSKNPDSSAASSSAGLALDGHPIFSQLVRLTHQQWERSVRDVLRLEDLPGLSESFTGDPPEGIFSNNERALLVTPNLSIDYQRAAEQLSERVARNGQALGRLDGVGDAASFIARLGRRAYRRPLLSDEQ